MEVDKQYERWQILGDFNANENSKEITTPNSSPMNTENQ